jgi:hypothetical protein
MVADMALFEEMISREVQGDGVGGGSEAGRSIMPKPTTNKSKRVIFENESS